MLVGGAGSRMGGDKPHRLFRGFPLYHHALGVLDSFCEPVCLVGGRSEEFAGRLCLDDERQGPLSGLMLGLQWSPHERIQVLPVDMPLVPTATLGGLARHSEPAVVPVVEGQKQPLCGLYAISLAPDLQAYLAKGERRVMGWLAELGERCRYVEVEGDFRNFNTLQELAEAE